MKKTLCMIACMFFGTADATLLTFDGNGSVTDDSTASWQGLGDTYTQDGYSLSVGAGDHFDYMGSNGIRWHDGYANTNGDNYAYLTFSGGLFDLNSFQLNHYAGDLITNLSSTVLQFSAGVHNVSLTGLTWAAFSPRGASWKHIYLDNINVSAAAVPEPSILALLGLGVAGIGFTRKKQLANNS